ncbi:PLP-dependent transferase [Gloeophyllum trabeum ATCC 11539]|uniref:PLP-dependent transferase n=1 Tax=Gloeophyllum trabeum (strain ATCC 11539 / FP-39264 / Madison 617) TaxID=670483 RepID=S7PYS1_GLOTA|nr:PLP-dependent transferase [Gloeophyllum trabeum ATCC 11539]EPQ52603.1 PLP-dependent transferase [Gloeophyllum trabeum ATCC 11539]
MMITLAASHLPSEGKCHTYDPQSTPPDFGHPMLQYFAFEDGFINLNNGAYGSLPLPVASECAKIAAEIEACPDRFMRFTHRTRLRHSRELVAQFIGAESADECVLVPNATHGLNTVLRNFEWHEGDIIIGASTTYGTIAQTMQYLSDIPPHPVVSNFPLIFPCTHAKIIDDWRKHVRSVVSSDSGSADNAKRKVVAVVDGIISTPGVRLPWIEMVKICREEGVWSVVDGAHLIGQVDINLAEADPDFFVSRMRDFGIELPQVDVHETKLLCTLCTKAVAIPTAHEYVSPTDPRAPNFVDQHEWTGTLDHVPYLSIPAGTLSPALFFCVMPHECSVALEFRKWIGGERKINEYCHQLALDGGKRLAEIIGTSVMENEKGELTANAVNVELPLAGVPATLEVDQFLKEQLLFEWHCYAAHYYHNGRWWTRCSAAVWLEVSDFEYLGKAFTEICKLTRDKFAKE